MWALKVANSHFSFKSSEDVSHLLRRMFPDSQIAAQFACGESKCSYLCSFGLAPHFKSLTLSSVLTQRAYVILFTILIVSLNTTFSQFFMCIYRDFTKYLVMEFGLKSWKSHGNSLVKMCMNPERISNERIEKFWEKMEESKKALVIQLEKLLPLMLLNLNTFDLSQYIVG